MPSIVVPAHVILLHHLQGAPSVVLLELRQLDGPHEPSAHDPLGLKTVHAAVRSEVHVLGDPTVLASLPLLRPDVPVRPSLGERVSARHRIACLLQFALEGHPVLAGTSAGGKFS